jgi:hypothetical protein
LLKPVIAALAGALLAGAAASGASAHSGGGHGGGYVIVYMAPGGPPPALFQGQEASMSLEVTDAPPTMTEGEAKLDDVVAVHQVRAADAIVLLAPIKARRRDVPAGTVLVRARFVDPGQRAVVWCDVRPTGFPFSPFNHDCFEDTKGSGQLDKMWRADYGVGGFLGFSRSGVDAAGGPMPAPAAYRPARPEERPTAFIGYKYCDGDDVSSPARFRLTAGADFDPTRWKLVGDCRAGLWSDPADKSKVDVDGLHMIVTPVAQGAIHFSLVDRIAPGPIGPVVRYAPLRNVPQDPAARQAALKSALVAAGEPPKVATGPVAVGGTFLTVPVKHGLTGRLLVRVHPTIGLFWPKGTVMEVGQPVFGVPADTAPGDGIAWCVATKTAAAWQTACLSPVSDAYMAMAQTSQGYYWLAKQKPALAPTRRSLGGGGEGDPENTDPAVALGPIDDGPPMTASLKLAAIRPRSKTDATLVYDVEVDLDWGEGPQPINRIPYTLSPDGQTIRVLGQVLLLQPGASPGEMSVTAPTTPVAAPSDVELLATR